MLKVPPHFFKKYIILKDFLKGHKIAFVLRVDSLKYWYLEIVFEDLGWN